jgi:DNA polymerase
VPTSIAVLTEQARGCTRCKLAALGRTQVVVGTGDPEADLLFVGEGPGAEEDRQGLPFVGRSGKLLDQLMLEELGVTRDRVYITNVVKCRPPDNRDPESDEIASCNPWLDQQLELIDPAVIVTLGKFAAQLLLDSREGITRLRGRTYPFGSRTLVPTVHPAYVLRGGGGPMAQMRADLVRAKRALADRGVVLA